MTDKMLIDRSVVEQALEALKAAVSDDQPYIVKSKEAVATLRAALEQPQVEQPVAVIGDVWTLNWVGSDPIATIVKKHGLKIGDKLYTHPQNLRCKSNQARLATLWGYEKPQPPRQPLKDADLGVYVSKELADYTAGAYADYGCTKDQLIHFARAIERAHGIIGE